jgi:hypothetical protein
MCSIIAFALPVARTSAQSLPIGTSGIEDYYRRQQLSGKLDSTLSFTVRPTYNAMTLKVNNIYDPDSTLSRNSIVGISMPVSFANGHGVFQMLPISIQQQYNSNHPYGWNDGLMIPAKGYQTLVSAGLYAKLGPLSIQFQPEYVYAQNSKFDGFASGHNDADLLYFYRYHNLIDQPERLADGAYNKASWGQSSIRLTFGPASIGLSNENLWWGPGMRNTLILSNNAPGFKHLTLNTIRPIHTYIGSFEGQIIAGRLDGTNRSPLEVTTNSTRDNLYVPKRTEWRYYTGYNISYQPKWIPGLFLGMIRTFDSYNTDVNGFSGYFPYFVPFQKAKTDDGDPFDRDQQTSFYARWVFTKAKAEIYFDYGLNDNSYNYRDFIGSPEHSRAYVFGLRKLFPWAADKNQGLLFSAELTQLSQTIDYIIRDSGGWYIHSQVTAGQTHQGQILGAGTGSGGNLQSMDLSWVSGLKKIGLNFERYEHDVDFANYGFVDINGNSRKWVDFAMAVQGVYNYKNLIFNAKLQAIKSLNYQWVLKDYNLGQYYIPHNDVFNMHAELGVSFRF